LRAGRAVPIALVAACLSLLDRSPSSARASASGQAQSSAPGRSLVLITAEGIRPDFLSCYGKGACASTPNIDSLASQGKLFQHVLAPSVSSLPSLATVMTGKTPFQHQVWDDDYRNKLSGAETTLAERLKAKGYQTGAFLGSSRATAERGLNQGFEVYQDGYIPTPSGTWRLTLRTSRAVVEGARSWVSGLKPGPFFLWLHMSDPIVPGRGTPSRVAEDLKPTYKSRIESVDSEIGELLKILQSRKDFGQILIVFTSDHGFGLGDHGESRSGAFAYESTLRVPLILRDGAPATAPVQDLAGLVDVYPTLESLLGLSPAPGLLGRDLLGKSAGAQEAYEASALQGRELFGWAASEAIAQGKWRLILGPSTRLYDVEADPDEQHDQSGSNPDQVKKLKELARSLAGGKEIPPAHFLEGPVPPSQTVARIKALGFVAPSRESAAARALPDPASFRDSLLLLEEMQFRTEIVGYSALKVIQDDILKANPESLFSLVGVSLLNIDTGDAGMKKAGDLLKTAQRIYPLEPEVYHTLAHLAFPQKKFDDAVFFLNTALQLRPRYKAELVYDLACAYAREGKKSEALAKLKESIDLGFHDHEHILADPDLAGVKEEAGFKKLMAESFPPPTKS
jgi:tetratricopeptide (TPR) repeat protein